jgi:predicted ATPase
LVQQTKPTDQELTFEYSSPSKGFTLQGRVFVEDGELRVERLTGAKKPNAIFLTARQQDNTEELAQRLSNLAVSKQVDKIVKVLQIIRPDLQDLTVQFVGGIPIIHGDLGRSRLMPLPLMGDGMGRLLNIALAIPQAADGLVLIDEVENGLHYTIVSQVWKAVAAMAREYDAQVFATTHSYECIQAAHQAFTETEGTDFYLHRLEEVEGVIRAVTLNLEDLGAALETGWEVR